ncbi:MAG: hypothetical protein AAF821_08205 [Cyanobacteria bacterium P01_D01_bin.156]
MFSYNTDLDSPVGIVFQYLTQNPHLPRLMGKRKGVDAIFAFWRPFAFQAMGQASDAALKLMARESLKAIATGLNTTCGAFDMLALADAICCVSPFRFDSMYSSTCLISIATVALMEI